MSCRIREFLGLAISVVILVTLYIRMPLSEKPSVYEDEPPPLNLLAAKRIHLHETASALGVDHIHTLSYPGLSNKKNKFTRGMALGSVMPSLAVEDIDGDGFYDFLVTDPGAVRPLTLFKNLKGKRFKDITKSSGLKNIPLTGAASVATLVDLNKDDLLDIFVATWGCHLTLKGQPNLKFTPWKLLDAKICNGTNAVAIGDLNDDQYPDLVLGNYAPKSQFQKPDTVQGAGDKENGEQNLLLINDHGKSLKAHSPFKYKAYTMGAGLSDINDDGEPDILFTNDYSTDELYFSNGDERLEYTEVTESQIPIIEHGYAGMNADFGDFNGDGLLDIYISNIYKPPFYISGNVLWQQTKDGFVNMADSVNVRRCGWSWTAKFADFDNDSSLDLLVTNGRFRGPTAGSKDESKSYWYHRSVERSTPRLLRDFLPFFSKDFRSDFELSGFERSCLFTQFKGKYYDIAEEAGIGSEDVTRSLALIDFNNDGKIDVITGQFGARLKIFENISDTDNVNWVGLDLRSSDDQRPFGALLRVFDNKKLIYTKELYPTNGFRGQSDPRFLIGLGEKTGPFTATVVWPNSKREIFSNLKINQYQKIKEGHGETF